MSLSPNRVPTEHSRANRVRLLVSSVRLALGRVGSTSVGTSACVPRLPASFSPLASLGEVNKSLYPSKSQAFPYPNAPATTNFENIIITNTFQIRPSDGRCLLVSPLFWTLVVLGHVVIVVLVLMTVLYWTSRTRDHFHSLTKIFQHTDLIGAGELWVGGLISFALLLLITFAFCFGSVYVKQYPIETAGGDSTFSCDPTLRNAKLTSSLQLLALLRTDEVQTGFQCSHTSVQGIIESYRIALRDSRCLLQPDRTTALKRGSFLFPFTPSMFNSISQLPSSCASFESNLSLCLLGNAYIGALRVCLNGATITSSGNSSTVKELSFSQLLSQGGKADFRSTEVPRSTKKYREVPRSPEVRLFPLGFISIGTAPSTDQSDLYYRLTHIRGARFHLCYG